MIIDKCKQVYIDGSGIYLRVKDCRLANVTLSVLALVEKKYWYAKMLRDKYYDQVRLPALKQIADNGGKAHCKVTHKHEGSQDWWLYTVSKEGETHDWVDEPKEPLNLSLGTNLYVCNRRGQDIGRRVFNFKSVFSIILETYLWENLPTEYGSILELILNGRAYIYGSDYNGYGVLHWNKLFWQEAGRITCYGDAV